MLASIVRLWAFSSASKSPMLVPASTLGSPVTAPVLTSTLSASVVFPQPPWPHRAMLRMSSTLCFDMPVSLYRRASVSLARSLSKSCTSETLVLRPSADLPCRGKRRRQRQRSFVQCPSHDAARQAKSSQPPHIVRRRDAAGSDHIDFDRRVHLGHRVEIRALQHAIAGDVGVDNCRQRVTSELLGQLDGVRRAGLEPSLGCNQAAFCINTQREPTRKTMNRAAKPVGLCEGPRADY